MKFKEKASSIAIASILMATSIVPVNALTKFEIVGENRYETAAKVADEMGSYSKAILVNGTSIADGLSASGLAGKENAPILLVKKDSIPKETLQRLYKVKKVYIIGKENAVSSRVENSLNQSGISVKRLGGDDRIGTSLEVSREMGSYSKAFLVNGMKGEADAMSVASVAAREKAPIILTNGKDRPTYDRTGVKYYVVGGTAVMSDSLAKSFKAERLSGDNRYATNKVVVEKFYPNTDKLYFAKGDSLIDALAVSPLAKTNGLALVNENSDKTVFYGKDNLVQVGGMSPSTVNKVFDAVYEEPNNNTPKPDDNTPKPDEDKPNEDKPNEDKPNENKPNGDIPKPEGTYNINSPEFQKLVRTEFYRLLDEHRAANNRSKIEHHWACEESSLAKSKHMVENNYYSHRPWVEVDHLIGAAENITWINTNSKILDKEEADWVAERLFLNWKLSEGHNRILLGELSNNEIYNGHHGIDGVSFYGEWDPSTETYSLKATYHSSTSGDLWDTPDTTNKTSPGYVPKTSTSHIPEENILNITEIFK